MSTLTVARWTGAAYLGLAVAGGVGHLGLTGSLVVGGDPTATLQNLHDHPLVAQLAVMAELLVVITQALAAWGFWALFHRDAPAAAFGTASFGLANAVLILGSAGMLQTAGVVASDPSLAPGGDAAATVGLLAELSSAAWQTGAVFFGLWLIPMGLFALTTARMPRALGWALVIGGVAYVVSSVLLAFPALTALGTPLAMVATVGELWMIGYLLSVGIRGGRGEQPVREPLRQGVAAS
ncbi:DUF4386 domain-containing protein [Homoserinibacter sp. GY 40078]|uniref:DUF4386 domain-containing protein n=1 Tax=Homoserinibacter sp. GY 40078 TaxID=2603275 RepID=UPI0011C9CD9A|nr:DUF4386 domain-containing protein [Homoserinibacter sp. GY 40078]TXK19465.1 DUF4386 domain-containing protein [Homoserinibacter sp. GY 40078]